MILEPNVAIVALLVLGAVLLLHAFRVRSQTRTYDGAPRTQVEATRPDGTHVRRLLEPPAPRPPPTRPH